MVRKSSPRIPFQRLDTMEVAFAFNLLYIVLIVSYPGWPTIGSMVGWEKYL